MKTQLGRIAFGLALPAVLLTLAGPASSDETALSVQSVSSPFTVFVREGDWMQQTAILVNPTPSAARLTIACQAFDPQRGHLEFTRTVEVPSRTIREADLAFQAVGLQEMRPDRPAPDAPAPKTADKNKSKDKGKPKGKAAGASNQRVLRQDYVLREASTGRQLAVNYNTLSPLPPDGLVLGMLNQAQIDGDSYTYLKEADAIASGPVAFCGTQFARAPDVWYGYSQTDVLFLGGAEASSLRPSQTLAILDWVRRGGLLVITCTPELPRLLAGEIGRAAGVTAVGVHWVDSLTLAPDKGAKAGEPVKLPTPLPMAELLVTDAEVLHQANALPLMTRRRLGDGHVMVLATPIGALAPDKLQNPWRQISLARRRLPALGADTMLAAGKAASPSIAQQTLQQVAGVIAPSPVTAGTVLLILAGVVAVGGVTLAWRRRTELLWVGVVPLSILLSVALLCIGKAQSDPERLSHIGLITSVGDGRARVQQAFAYYSPEPRKVTFHTDSPEGLIGQLGLPGATMLKGIEIQRDNGLALANVEVNGSRAFQVDTVTSLAAIRPVATFNESGLAGVVENRLPANISDAVIFANGQTYRLDGIAAGANTTFIVDDQRQLAAGEFTSSLVKTQTESLRNKLVTTLLHKGDMQHSVSTAPIVIGYTGYCPLNPLPPDRNPARRGWSVLVWPLELTAPASGAKVRIPAGFVDREYAFVDKAIWSPAERKFNPVTGRATLALLCRPPAVVGSLRQAALDVVITMPLVSDFKLHVLGATGLNGKTPQGVVPIREIAAPGGQKIRVRLDNADRFRDKQGNYIVLLKMEPLNEDASEAALLDSGSAWKFDAIDVALEGIAP